MCSKNAKSYFRANIVGNEISLETGKWKDFVDLIEIYRMVVLDSRLDVPVVSYGAKCAKIGKIGRKCQISGIFLVMLRKHPGHGKLK